MTKFHYIKQIRMELIVRYLMHLVLETL